jgi:hypothetical protein
MTEARAVDLVQASRWFAALFGDLEGLIEMRALPGAHRVFFRREAGREARRFVHQHGELNLYAGIALRQRPNVERGRSRSGALERCIALPALFIDLDFKMTPVDQAREALRRFPLRPSIVVRSGGGVHLYWLLREPMDLQEQAAGRAKELLRRLARHLGGDLSSAEPARILRIPGTFNFKYSPARPVTLERLEEGTRFNPGDFDSLLPGEPFDTGPGKHFSVPEKISAGGRNSTLYRLGRSLKARGLSESEITAALAAANAARCRPPLEDSEVRLLAHNVAMQQDQAGFTRRRKGVTREELIERLRSSGKA